MRKLQMEAVKHLAYIRRQRIWKWAVAGLACLVVFCTAYALVLPAVTLERSAECGLEEHEHSAACYTLLAENYNCDIDVHQHTDDCYDFDGNEICGYADFVLHQHDELCYDQDGNLVCPLEEKTSYDLPQITPPMEDAVFPEMDTELDNATPSALDFELLDDWFFGGRDTAGYDAHQHDESCYDADGRLICGLLEVQRHQHSLACLTDAALTCGMEEHVHSAACMPEYEAPEEEQAQTEAVIALIDALPAQAEIEEILTAFEEAGDEEGYDAYLTQLVAQAKAAYEAYAALTEEQQQQVANADKLLALEPLWSIQMLPANNSTGAMNLFVYAGNNGGEAELTISDENNVQLGENENGEYDVVAGENYTVRVSYRGNKLERGKYFVSFPAGIATEAGGELSCTDNAGQEIGAGNWYFESKDGTTYLIFDITGDLSKHSAITLAADVKCVFNYTETPIEFDGNITVKVSHNRDATETEVNKWVKKQKDENGNDVYIKDGKIRWGSEIYGNSNSNILGSTVTDTITTPDTHYFSEDDKKKGISFEATEYKHGKPFTAENRGEIHHWTVGQDNPDLTWTETGWSYTMPDSIYCIDCKAAITLGNDDWLYYISYTTTVKNSLSDGTNEFKNQIACDEKVDSAKFYTGITNLDAGVTKTGRYVKAAEPNLNSEEGLYANDAVEWTITARIPAARQGEKYDYFWYLWDTLVVNEAGKETQWKNELKNIQVTAQIGDSTIVVPAYGTNAAEKAEICWRRPYEEYSGQQIDFYTKCHCTAENCAIWKNGHCDDQKQDGYCRCWSYDREVLFTIIYSTPAAGLCEEHGGKGATLVNTVALNNKELVDGVYKSVPRGDDEASVPIPGIFTKNLTEQPEDNGLIAQYTITVNEAKADLSGLSELIITDTMSLTLNLIPSSLEIQYENEEGEITELEKDQYKVTTVETVKTVKTEGSEEGEKEELKKRFTITLKQEALGPYKYILTYNASVSEDSAVGLTYQNSASINLKGAGNTITGDVYNLPQAAIGAETYTATLRKQDSTTQNALAGAVFSLFAHVEGKEDVRMHDYTTDDSGFAKIQTNSGEGVILHQHVLYYVQETTAPKGYQLDDAKHYFWFCDQEGDCKEKCSMFETFKDSGATCIYSKVRDSSAHLTITNEAIKGYELPQTGGVGTKGYMMTGVLLAAVSAVLLYQRGVRRKEES